MRAAEGGAEQMRWILKFRRAADPDGGINAVVVECREEDLQGEKERIGAELEEHSGEAWICAEIVPLDGGRRMKERRLE